LYGRPRGAREDHRAAEKRTRLPYRAHPRLRRQQRLAAARRPHAQSADELPDRHRCRAAPPLAQTHRTPAPLDRADIALHALSSRGTTGAPGGQVDLAPGEESRNRKLVHAHRTRATLCGLSFCRIRVNYTPNIEQDVMICTNGKTACVRRCIRNARGRVRRAWRITHFSSRYAIRSTLAFPLLQTNRISNSLIYSAPIAERGTPLRL